MPSTAVVATGISTGLLVEWLSDARGRVSWPAATDPSDPTRPTGQHSARWRCSWTAARPAASTRPTSVDDDAARPVRVAPRTATATDEWAHDPGYWISAVGDRSALLTYRGTWGRTTSGASIATSRRRGHAATASASVHRRGVAVVAPTSRPVARSAATSMASAARRSTCARARSATGAWSTPSLRVSGTPTSSAASSERPAGRCLARCRRHPPLTVCNLRACASALS